MKHLAIKNVGRRTKAVIAIVSSAAAVVAAVGVVPSLAGWTHTEVDNGTLGSLGCSTTGSFTTGAWGQEIAGEVANVSLDSHLAGVLGTTVASGAPHSTATGGAGSSGLTYLGNDAWSSNLQAGALNAISLGAGVSLPIGANTGVETQYGRASSTGVATGASGAVTTASNGLVSLDTPTSTTPGVGTLDLSTALSNTIGKELAGKLSQLANASLDVGAVGSTTSVDSCNDLWQGLSDASQVARQYVLAKLALNFHSSLVGDVVTDTTNGVNSIQTTLNGLEPNGTLINSSDLTSALTTALSSTTAPLGVSLSGTPTVKLGVTFDLSPVLNDITGAITSGPVTINLGTGRVSIDLSKLAGVTSLNSLDPNTPLITTATLKSITDGIDTAISTFLTGTIQPAINAVLNAAKVKVSITAGLGLNGTNAASLDIELAGTIAQFVDPTHNGQPTVTVGKIADTPGAAGILGFVLGVLGETLDAVIDTVLVNVVAPLTTNLVPVIGTLLGPIVTSATTAVASGVSTLLTATIDPVIDSLKGVIGVIGDAVQLTVNDQPDQANPVGSPEPTATGKVYESALHVGVLNTVDGSSTIDLFLGSSAVGPNTKN